MALSNYVEAVIEEKDWYITNLSNVAACLWQQIPDVSWVGFYLMTDKGNDKELILGPFQGKVACTHIALGRGVCGVSASENKTLIVPDVSQFSGYIACDSEARSEIVIPLRNKDGVVIGVLDIDSNTEGRFSEANEESADLEKCAELISNIIPKTIN
ncbi:GAF domain-containing protein [Butyrivibrio sp. INlla16]|uniref:GAF domain-containing protein n=1 Tax=Butyrivibrio sp. INlla16 TaxID=1520807 RepID=UPI000882A565|nr:GAF domain-containing protein [Butyrivibrio sp. INlla16]SDB03377.1 GAF domain-containing protein [Butyrivibrio sp. INlla16]